MNHKLSVDATTKNMTKRKMNKMANNDSIKTTHESNVKATRISLDAGFI